uniref:Calponin-homology (CH) domain-containing protein n=1 Tax=Parascaris univalens TaxID=6257 RepID=A0A915A7H3_PARUN
MQRRERMAFDDEMEQMLTAGTQPDAGWKIIQQNTFTRWVNQQLKSADVSITDLETDFEDGLKLIRLVEVLSGRSLGKYSKKVAFRSQKLENNALVLNFLENEEHIKIVNIDSSAIVDRNLKLILGLVWTLVLHYSIAQQIWELPEDSEKVVERSPKEKLMLWIRGKLPDDINLKNFTSDWNSGILLGALVDSCAPDLHIGWRSWDPADALQSTRIAMDVAEKHLSVVPLITAEELINPAVDEKSIMTYLAQFPQARYKPPIGFIENEGTGHAVVGQRCEFKLNTISESILVDVLVNDPDGKFVDVVVAKEAPQLYSIQYFPRMEGRYAMTLKLREATGEDSLELFVETMVVAAEYRFTYNEVAQVGKPVMFSLENAGDGVTEV